MLTAGIDSGTRTTRVMLLDGAEVIGKSQRPTSVEPDAAAEHALADALGAARLERTALGRIAATGAGRSLLRGASMAVTEVRAAARGSTFTCPSARTAIDVGAEEARIVRCTAEGQVTHFAVNEKCAAGAGIFIETMARALQVPLSEMGPLARSSQIVLPINAQCTVFAESEVISLIHANTPKADIARAIHEAIAGRIATMVRRIGVEKDIVLIGGLALNPGFVDALQRALGERVLVPPDPEYVAATGAALVARG